MKDISVLRITPDTTPEDVCPTCRAYVKLRAVGVLDENGEPFEACSDPACLSSHGYGENGVCRCVVNCCDRYPCKGQCGCKPCERNYYDAIEYD